MALAATATWLALAPGSGWAASAWVTQHPPPSDSVLTGQVVHFQAAPGEANDLRVSLESDHPTARRAVFRDATASLEPGPGCAARDLHTVYCTLKDVADACDVDLGDSADRFTMVSQPAYGCRVHGGPGPDRLEAPDAGRATFEGDEGDDVLVGGFTGMRLLGGPGDDRVIGGRDVDYIDGGGGRDVLSGGGRADYIVDGDRDDGDPATRPDADIIDGGAGGDRVAYSQRTTPVRVDLSAPADRRAPDGDQLRSIEHVRGTRGDDVLIGDSGPNHLDGGGGHDDLRGGPGRDRLTDGDGRGTVDADRLDGGPGRDTVSYSRRRAPLRVDLSRPAPQGEAGEGDSLVGVEGVIGGHAADVLLGGPGHDVLDGGPGGDVLIGRAGNDQIQAFSGDSVDAGPGNDRVVPLFGSSWLLPTLRKLRCGEGRDRVQPPLTRTYVIPADCEVIELLAASVEELPPGKHSGPMLMTAHPWRAGPRAVGVRFHCLGVIDSCQGTVAIVPPGRFASRRWSPGARFHAKGSRTITLRIPLTDAGVRRVHDHLPVGVAVDHEVTYGAGTGGGGDLWATPI